jgi:hypothetical protein
MAVKKIEIRPKGTGNYADVLYPKTSTDMVVDEASGKTVATHMADDTAHITSTERATWNSKADGSHSHNASEISVADSGNHFAGTNVETALDELFQFANNGKTDIASVVGSPATSGDTFATLKTHIQNSKNTMATNLSNKGQASNGTETLQSLASKIGNVSTGKKFASGTTTSSGSTSYYNISISGLDFTPSSVVVVRKYGSSYMYIIANPKITELQNAFIQASSGGNFYLYTYGTYKLYDGGFYLRFITNTATVDDIYWYAYE